MSYTETWSNARAKRAARRAADPRIQARAEAHHRREIAERQAAARRAERAAVVDTALAVRFEDAS